MSTRAGVRRRSLFIVAAAALLPIVLLCVVLVQISSSALQDQARAQVHASALASATSVEQQLEKLTEIVAIYSENPETARSLKAGDADGLRAILRSLFDDRSDVSMAFASDAGGVTLDVLPETPEAIGVDFSFRDWFIGAESTGAAYVSEAFQPQSDLPLTMIVASPVFDADDPAVVVGYLGIGWSLVDMQSTVDDFSDIQNVSLTVTDQSGAVVASPGAAPTSIELVGDDPAIAAALQGVDTQREVVRDGVTYLSASESVDSFGWTVTADVEASEAFAARTTVVSVAVGLGLLLVALVAAVLFGMSRSWRRQDLDADRRRESEAFLESIIENIPSAVTVKDASTLEFVRGNPAALGLLGLEEHELIGSTARDLFPAWVADRQEKSDRRVIAGRVVVVEESVEMIEEFGGRTIDVRSIPMVNPDGEVTYLLEIADDVTETLASLHELQAAWAEAEKANEAKSDFLSRMSHELRTPLNAVLGFGQLLQFEDLTPQQVESVNQILRGGRHLLGLINEVLDISRIESGNLSLSVEPVALQPLITETLDLVRPLAAAAALSLPEGPMPDWNHWARADQQRLRQVMLNLLSNAVKYNKPDGVISVRCHAVGDRRIRINVSDTGRGLSQDQADRIFSPFERLGAEGSAVEGTGLGLALTKRLVEAMHGAIGLETELGVGTTFWVELGVSNEAELVTGGPAASIDTERTENIARLIHVEDSFERLRWVEDLVSTHPDIELISIADAETAMDMAVRFQPDAMLIDRAISGVDAQELLDRLAADPATASIVILTVGDAAADDGGAHQHLVKPISDADLLAAISDALAVAKALSR